MFKKGKKTIFDYVTDHEPYNAIEELTIPNYLEGTISVDHKELESDIAEYWDLIHPLIADFINSYANSYTKIAVEVSKSREDIDAERRKLTFEQQNVQDLTDEIRSITGSLQNESVIRRDLEERLRDERAMMESQFAEEKRSLTLIADSKLAEGVSLENVLKQVGKAVSSSEEVKRLKNKVTDLEEKIKSEREENETIQGELSMSFMEKITKYDEMIQNLKARLGDED